MTSTGPQVLLQRPATLHDRRGPLRLRGRLSGELQCCDDFYGAVLAESDPIPLALLSQCTLDITADVLGSVKKNRLISKNDAVYSNSPPFQNWILLFETF